MVRKTETRALVSEMALRLLKQGQTPSVKLVREALGGGSPNVIAEELRRWREDQARLSAAPCSALPPSAPPSPEIRDSPPSSIQLLEALHVVRDLVRSQRAAEADASEGRRHIVAAAQEVAEGLRAMQAMMASLEADRKSTAERLERIEARYEGIRKHMLLAVEEAREETRRWKDRVAQLEEESNAWRNAAQQRIGGRSGDAADASRASASAKYPGPLSGSAGSALPVISSTDVPSSASVGRRVEGLRSARRPWANDVDPDYSE